MDEALIFGTLNELADALGESNQNSILSSLLCPRTGITFDQKGKIVVAFNQVLNKYDNKDLKVEYFHKALYDAVPEAKKYANELVVAFIKAIALNHLDELIPFVNTLI